MKIAILISSLRCGGTEKTASLLANAWISQGDQVQILTLSGPEVGPFFPLDPKVQHLPLGLQGDSPTKLHGLLNNAKRVFAIRRTLRRLRPDVVVAFMEGTTALAILAAAGLRLPVVLSEVAVPALQSSGFFWRIVRKLLYPFATAIVVPSQGVQHYFAQDLKLRCSVIPNPVERNPRPKASAHGPARLVAVGRLSREKGFDTLLAAMALVHQAHPETRLTIYGEGPLRAELESMRDALGLRSIVEMPGTTRSLANEFHAFDIFILSSRYEGFGNVLCEAMAAGLAVVSFDCPTGPREIIRDGIDGLLVPANDAAALANTINRLIENEEQRIALAQRAPDIVSRLGIEQIAQRWRELWAPVARSF